MDNLCDIFSGCHTRTPYQQYTHLVQLQQECENAKENSEVLLSKIKDIVPLYLRNLSWDSYSKLEIKKNLIIIKNGLNVPTETGKFKLIKFANVVFKDILNEVDNF